MKALLSHALMPVASLYPLWRKFQQLWAYTLCRSVFVHEFDPSNVVLNCPEIHGSGKVHFGKDAYLYQDLYFETREQAEIQIGDGVVMSRGAHLVAYAGISIGEGSMIGEYVSIRDANHQYGSGIAPRESGMKARSIRIGRFVWIGRGSIILPGAVIGDFAVIGANSVVRGHVNAGTVVAGAPARNLHPRQGVQHETR